MAGVLIDTSGWSLYLRRRTLPPEQQPVRLAVRDLVAQGEGLMIGPVRQELLNGVRSRTAFVDLRDRLRVIPDEPLVTSDFERAAEFANTCRAAGIQGSPVDFLLCAVADRADHRILTLDEDFDRFEPHIPVPRYALR